MDTRTVLLVLLGVLGFLALVTASLAMDPNKDSRRLARKQEADSKPVGAVFVVLVPRETRHVHDHYHHHTVEKVERKELTLRVEAASPVWPAQQGIRVLRPVAGYLTDGEVYGD